MNTTPRSHSDNSQSAAKSAAERIGIAGDAGTVGAGSPANAAASAPQDADHWLVFVDGRFAPALSAIGGLPGGAKIGSLADALKQTPEAVEAAFGSASDGETPQALNAALATDGAWIRLGRGVVVEQPLHLVFIGATVADQHLRNLVVAEAGAQATIVEHYPAGAAGSTLTTAVTRVLAAQDSHVTHLKLQQEAPEAPEVANAALRSIPRPVCWIHGSRDLWILAYETRCTCAAQPVPFRVEVCLP